MILTCLGAYFLCLKNSMLRRPLSIVMIFTMYFSGGLVPMYLNVQGLGLMNSLWALIIPSAANAFGIFWMRQYCVRNIPQSILDAARIDGCSEWSIFFRVVTPVILPAYASLGIMQFVNVWNDFIQPMMILRKRPLMTLPLILRVMVGDRHTDYGALMLASTFAVLPLLVVFLLASKFFMSGLTAGAIKE
jgi:ABC-type glycerol-3-phosphate transport system permease component